MYDGGHEETAREEEEKEAAGWRQKTRTHIEMWGKFPKFSKQMYKKQWLANQNVDPHGGSSKRW